MMLKFISAGLVASTFAANMLGADECTYGPTHWCSDKKVAQKCNVEDHCRDNKLGVYGSVVRVDAPLEGANECTWGPRHWCSSPAVAQKCNKVAYCNRRRGRRAAQPSPLGEDECTWGPSHWCGSERVAKKCGLVDHCKNMGWGVYARSKRDLDEQPDELVGADECTWGPSHWCSDYKVAESCGQDVVDYCFENELGVFLAPPEPMIDDSEPLLGADECTWGPSHWCSDRSIAESCGEDAVNYCEEEGHF